MTPHQFSRGDVVRQAGINSLTFWYVEGLKDVETRATPSIAATYVAWALLKRWVDGAWLTAEFQPEKLELVMPALPPRPHVFEPGDLVHLKCQPSRHAMVVSDCLSEGTYRCVWQKDGDAREGLYSGQALEPT